MPSQDLEERIWEDALKDVLDDPEFRLQATTDASRAARRRIRQRQFARGAVLSVLVVGLLGYLVTVGPPSQVENPAASPPAAERPCLLANTSPGHVVVVRTRSGATTIVSTGDVSSLYETIGDQALLALFADRAPRLERGPDGNVRLILAN